MSRIKVIAYNDAQGRLREIYDELIGRRGKLADVHTIQSLRPESIKAHIDLYMEIMFSKSELSRAQREMIAVVVSVANACHYCTEHHGQALLNYWKDEQKLEKLKASPIQAGLKQSELALCRFAKELTLDPGKSKNADPTENLRNVGYSDAAILDATLVVAYFNFVNRIVLALGLELESDGGSGFNY
jgi:uncharacterized peroxidase-related enzyme